MSQVNLHTREGELKLTFNFHANRQYERKTGETAPQFVREVMMSQVKTHHLLAMLEVLLIKHHQRLRGTKLELVIESFIDKRGGSYGDLCAPIIEAITESGMFKISSKEDPDDEVEENELPDDPDSERIAEVLGGEEPEKKQEVAPDKDDPTT